MNGVGLWLYCSQRDLDDGFDPYQPTVASVPLPANAVLWLGVCPPKAYDWERSITGQRGLALDNVATPTRPTMCSSRGEPHGNIVLLQSEVKLWKGLELGFCSQGGCRRIRKGSVARCMTWGCVSSCIRVPTTSFAGPLWSRGHSTVSKGLRIGHRGRRRVRIWDCSCRQFGESCRRTNRDGLYFDGQYTDNPAALYALARSAAGDRRRTGDLGMAFDPRPGA